MVSTALLQLIITKRHSSQVSQATVGVTVILRFLVRAGIKLKPLAADTNGQGRQSPDHFFWPMASTVDCLPLLWLQIDFFFHSYLTLVGNECKYHYVMLKPWQNSVFSWKLSSASSRFGPQAPTSGVVPRPHWRHSPISPFLLFHFKWPFAAYG